MGVLYQQCPPMSVVLILGRSSYSILVWSTWKYGDPEHPGGDAMSTAWHHDIPKMSLSENGVPLNSTGWSPQTSLVEDCYSMCLHGLFTWGTPHFWTTPKFINWIKYLPTFQKLIPFCCSFAVVSWLHLRRCRPSWPHGLQRTSERVSWSPRKAARTSSSAQGAQDLSELVLKGDFFVWRYGEKRRFSWIFMVYGDFPY